MIEVALQTDWAECRFSALVFPGVGIKFAYIYKGIIFRTMKTVKKFSSFNELKAQETKASDFISSKKKHDEYEKLLSDIKKQVKTTGN